MIRILLVFAFFVSKPLNLVAASNTSTSHEDPITYVAIGLAIILILAKIGGDFAVRIGQPAVLGELIAGVIIGNLPMIGFSGLEFIEKDSGIEILASLGVLLLLFEVGLESTVGEMMKVGLTSAIVAVIGVAVPFALGYFLGAWLIPEAGFYVHLFLGATLCATSVGITARVLADLKRSQGTESRIILGAAVIDDVLGLIILAVVTGMVLAADQGAPVSAISIATILAKAAIFLFGSLWLGVKLTPRMFSAATRLRAPGVLLALGLSFCFFLAWLSGFIGLAPIVGAFAAGLILETVHSRDYVQRGEASLEKLVHPISSFLVPIFFVLMGMRTDLKAFAQPGVMALALAITGAAIIGKLACSLGVLSRTPVDRLSVGIGMIPRGEVGLIFARIGLGLSIGGTALISGEIFSAIVVMVILTTLITPPLLKWSLTRNRLPMANEQ